MAVVWIHNLFQAHTGSFLLSGDDTAGGEEGFGTPYQVKRSCTAWSGENSKKCSREDIGCRGDSEPELWA